MGQRTQLFTCAVKVGEIYHCEGGSDQNIIVKGKLSCEGGLRKLM